MKLKLTLILSLMICPLIANQIRMHSKPHVTRSGKPGKLDQSNVYRSSGFGDDELIIDIEVDDNINTEDLIPLWARLANKVAAPFFVLYSNFSKWWSIKPEALRLKKTRYMKRF